MSAPRRPPRRRVDGVLLLDKPTGISSNGALGRVRVGHGTFDRLDRDSAAELMIVRRIDDPHPAFTKNAGDLVPPY